MNKVIKIFPLNTKPLNQVWNAVMSHWSIPDLYEWFSDRSQHSRLGSMVQWLITSSQTWFNGLVLKGIILITLPYSFYNYHRMVGSFIFYYNIVNFNNSHYFRLLEFFNIDILLYILYIYKKEKLN